MNEVRRTEAEVIEGITRIAVAATPVDPDDLLVFQDRDGLVVTIDGRDYGDEPRKFYATNVHVCDTESFVNAVEDRRDDVIEPRVYADPRTYKVVALLNDDYKSPRRRDRMVSLDLTYTDAWNQWIGANDSMYAQDVFAQFVEDHMRDITDLASADLLEVVQSIEAHTSTRFKQAIRLSSGQRKFIADETITATAGADGDLEIPDQFTVSLSPWVGFDSEWNITAKLRYRLSGGLQLGYHLIDWKDTLDTAFVTDVVTPIRDSGLTTVLGTP